MVNLSTLLNPAGALVEAAAGAVEGGAAGKTRRATPRPAPAAHACPIDFLLDPATAGRIGRTLGTLVGRRIGVPGWAPAPAPRSATSTSRSSASSKEFGFLSDPKLTIEEKLMRLLAALSDRWEKEMQAKMDQIAADEKTEDGAASGSSSKTSSTKKSASSGGGAGLLGGIGDVFSGILGGGSGGGGLLGGVGDLFSGILGGGGGGGGLLGGVGNLFSGLLGGLGGAGGGGLGGIFDVLKMPGVKDVLEKVSGPVLAAAASALGCPMAAPLLMKLGPALVEGAAGFAAAADEGSSSSKRPSGSTKSSGSTSATSSSSRSSGSSSSTSSSSSASGDKKMSDAQRQLLMMEIQRIYERQKEMFGIVSNILKTSHDTRMNAVNNIR